MQRTRVLLTGSTGRGVCFGWIDGVRRAVDDESFSTRFTPRKSKSKWSVINIKRATELQAEGDARFLAKLKASKRAWVFFEAQPPWYRRTSSFWVMEAKREETRERRLAELIATSAKGEPSRLLDRRPPAVG